MIISDHRRIALCYTNAHCHAWIGKNAQSFQAINSALQTITSVKVNFSNRNYKREWLVYSGTIDSTHSQLKKNTLLDGMPIYLKFYWHRWIIESTREERDSVRYILFMVTIALDGFFCYICVLLCTVYLFEGNKMLKVKWVAVVWHTHTRTNANANANNKRLPQNGK